MFFWKILEVSIFGRLVCIYCLLKDDMPFVSRSCVTEVEKCDYIEKSGFFFQKAKTNGSDDFNLEVTKNDSLALS